MSKQISKTTINFWLDLCLLGILMFLCWTTIVVRYVFPQATQAEGWTLWGWDYLNWTDLQFGALCVLVAAVLLHVMLHWTWVCGVVSSWQRKRRGAAGTGPVDGGSRTLWGVGLLIVIINVLGLAIAAASLSVQAPAL